MGRRNKLPDCSHHPGHGLLYAIPPSSDMVTLCEPWPRNPTRTGGSSLIARQTMICLTLGPRKVTMNVSADNAPRRDFRERMFARFAIPGATVSFKSIGFWQWRKNRALEEKSPVVDIGKGGMAFLTDRPPRARRIILLLDYSNREDALLLEGTVVYHAPRSDRIGLRYRVGVEFLPFSAKPGDNSLEALGVLDKLERTYCPQKTG